MITYPIPQALPLPPPLTPAPAPGRQGAVHRGRESVGGAAARAGQGVQLGPAQLPPRRAHRRLGGARAAGGHQGDPPPPGGCVCGGRMPTVCAHMLCGQSHAVCTVDCFDSVCVHRMSVAVVYTHTRTRYTNTHPPAAPGGSRSRVCSGQYSIWLDIMI
jgi:hypothetical protein